MIIDFILPDIGEGIVECELVEWLVSAGDSVVEDQPIADVMTDKALVQIPAMHNGVVDKLYYKQGDIAKVHSPLFSIIVEDEVAVDKIEQASVTENNKDNSATRSMSSQTVDFILPDIGEGIVECELVEWLVAQGDIVEEDQPIADVMTDKALVQIPAMHAGKITQLYYAQGDIAKVHSPLFEIEYLTSADEVTDSKAIQTDRDTRQVESESINAEKNINTEEVFRAEQPSISEDANVPAPQTNKKVLASPAVRRVAKEFNININNISGSGKKGRVYKEDIYAYISDSKQKEAHKNSVTQTGGTRTEAIKGVKAVMAKAMVESVSTIPHFTYCDEIDLTDLTLLRGKLKESYAKQGIKLTLMPFFMKAMSLALIDFPLINAKVNDECTEITYFNDHNIGMAVDSKIGLIVPNVKHVQTLTIVELAQEITRLTDDARSGRVATSDLKGGTISISNVGAIGGTIATPIINKPESAIVALGKLQKLPRYNENGEVEARTIMQVSWSGDHRIIDGGTIARFCNLWKAFLENPTLMMMNMT